MHEILHFVQNDKRGVFIIATQSLEGGKTIITLAAVHHRVSRCFLIPFRTRRMGRGKRYPSLYTLGKKVTRRWVSAKTPQPILQKSRSSLPSLPPSPGESQRGGKGLMDHQASFTRILIFPVKRGKKNYVYRIHFNFLIPFRTFSAVIGKS
jgi:hypothetical protein